MQALGCLFSIFKVLFDLIVLLARFFQPRISQKSSRNPYRRGRPSTKAPPNSVGGYRIVDKKDSTVRYVGISNSLKRRQSEHQRSGKYDPNSQDFVWRQAKPKSTYDDLRRQEKREIKKHNPLNNRNLGGGGRTPKA